MPPSRHLFTGLLAVLALASSAMAADDSVWVRFPNGVEKRGVLVSQSPLSLRIAETQWERMREMYLTIRYERVAELRINGVPVDTPVTLAAVERARHGLPAPADSCAPVARPLAEDSSDMAPAPQQPVAPSTDSTPGGHGASLPPAPPTAEPASPASPPTPPGPEAPAAPPTPLPQPGEPLDTVD